MAWGYVTGWMTFYADISVNVANFIIKLYVSFIPSSVAPSGCFREPSVAWSNTHLSLMRSLLPGHGPSCSVNPYFSQYCCHRAQIACFSTVLMSACHHVCCCKRDKKPHSSCSIIPLSSLSSSNLHRVSALRASSRKWLRLWNLSLIPLTVPLLEGACLYHHREKSDDFDWLVAWF